MLGFLIRIAAGFSVFQMVPTDISATWISFGTGYLNLRVIGFLLIGSIPGASLGPRLLACQTQKFN